MVNAGKREGKGQKQGSFRHFETLTAMLSENGPFSLESNGMYIAITCSPNLPIPLGGVLQDDCRGDSITSLISTHGSNGWS